MSLNIVFAGTPEFAVPTLEKIVQSEHHIVGVYTQPDRPAGRGQQLHASPVKKTAQAHHLPIFQPKTLRDATVQNQLRELNPDIMIVVAYGLILPEAILQIPHYGCVNVHPSLLPRWRGAAPIPRTIEAGDAETGITIMQMDKGMDTGPILKQEKIILQGNETTAQLHDLFSVRGAELVIETVRDFDNNHIHPIAQNHALAIHAAKIEKQEALINWKESAVQIDRKIRAFNAWPVAHTIFLNESLRIWEASVLDEKTTAAPGMLTRVEKEFFVVATGEGLLAIQFVQLAGKKRMSAADFINGNSAQLIPGKTKLG
ncbi:MAG: hypothetical protein ACD_42C00040G0001 [uncultured bacterium]|nr:MAG: hypothetical protein ACD_42C00040G0001 [uncultured bacterium]OGT32570.1 MAG: methionyl-tRNA formyltransferase [Gammaproteobacteria bacterium RIFCSPHIGHO2_02_FULL_39_13]OGT48380.1 MAG: methionyl-tRNA formyltransferase [Gammaproteobacteria bacterium RIFCSPHIGHO2_12_FULL_39_24]